MKIFIVIQSLSHGGAERVGVNLANGFVNAGNEVSVFTDTFQPKVYNLNNKVAVYPFRKKKCGKMMKWLSAIYVLRNQATYQHPDIIIAIMHLCAIISKVSVIGLSIPVVLSIHHAVGHRKVRYSIITRFFDRYAPRLYACTTVLSQVDKKYYGKKQKNITFIPNPLSFSPVNNVCRKKKVILAAGRLSDIYIKGWDILIEAWTKIESDFPEWRLVIVGGGSEKDERKIKQLIITLKAKEVYLPGYQKDMLSWYRLASVFVLSSRSEGLPMVLLEAMSQGCAPVCTDNDGRTAEIISNYKEGIICDANTSSLSDAMRTMIKTDAMRHAIQRAALKRSDNYSVEYIIQQWENIITNIKAQKL